MADTTDPFPELGSAYKSSGRRVNFHQSNHKAEKIGLNSNRVVSSWEHLNMTGSIVGKPNLQQSCTPNAWGQKVNQKPSTQSDGRSPLVNGSSGLAQNAAPRKLAGKGNARSQGGHRAVENNHIAPQPAIPTVEQKPSWSAIARSVQSKGSTNVQTHSSIADDKNAIAEVDDDDEDDESSDELYDSEDDLFNDDTESESENTYEKIKKSKFFNSFFGSLDKVSNEEINSPSRKWHCLACKGGQGAIDWYHGMESLMNHARTVKARRAKLHREFADVLDEVLRGKGISVIPTGDPYGRWEGLKEAVKDHEIVWPPMVIIMNTRYTQEENDKWIGMGNQELLDYFSSYAALKARHSYGPQGHRGMSVLIFEGSAAGYLEAVRLHKHFKDQGRDRDSWDSNRVLFGPGGKRQLYGYLAVKEDLDIFNQHCTGKTRLKFEMRSYQENVESQIKLINEDSQELVWLKNRVVKHQKQSEVLAESLSRVSEKLRKTTEENRIVRHRTKLQTKENKEEMDAQEQFFKEQIDAIHRAISAREEKFEKLQQEQREKVKKSYSNPFSTDDRNEEVAMFISSQDKEMEKFEAVREKLIERHEEEKVALKRRYLEEEVELEKKFEKELAHAMELFTQIAIDERQSTPCNG